MVVCEMVLRITELEAALREIGELIVQIPGGVDEDAHPEDEDPANLSAHVGGLIWQIVEAKLEGTT